jgi:glucose-6-phosphate 1-epimerase/putative transcriptional regulator
MMAFQRECAIYVGGPDDQVEPAILIHGIKDLPGAVEISPGTQIYRGGIEAAVEGVINGKYSPLEFRFFVGCHSYEESALDVAVHLGKYQPIACARSVALKQCISLPKPLWHEGKLE